MRAIIFSLLVLLGCKTCPDNYSTHIVYEIRDLKNGDYLIVLDSRTCVASSDVAASLKPYCVVDVVFDDDDRKIRCVKRLMCAD